jgi:hypothetical protein
VIGAVGIALICVVVVPALVWVGSGLLGVMLSNLLTANGEATHPGSELIETNV